MIAKQQGKLNYVEVELQRSSSSVQLRKCTFLVDVDNALQSNFRDADVKCRSREETELLVLIQPRSCCSYFLKTTGLRH